MESLVLSVFGIKNVKHMVNMEITARITKILWKFPVTSKICTAYLA